jgi:hypothetical protein
VSAQTTNAVVCVRTNDKRRCLCPHKRRRSDLVRKFLAVSKKRKNHIINIASP